MFIKIILLEECSRFESMICHSYIKNEWRNSETFCELLQQLIPGSEKAEIY